MIKTDEVKKIILEFPNSTLGKIDLEGLAGLVCAYLYNQNLQDEIDQAIARGDFIEQCRLLNIQNGNPA